MIEVHLLEQFPTKVQDCAKCREHYFANPTLVGAFASVGIEHGKSTWQMAEEYFARFHKAKHSDGVAAAVIGRKLRFSRKQLYQRTRKPK